jgi:PQQ-dependent catabolism-associated CXXCW motif protein
VGARQLFVLALSVALPLAAAVAPPEPNDYRTDDYRSATPATLNGAPALTTDEAHRLWQDRAAAFIDVLPRPPRPANLPADVVWRDKTRYDIPDSHWLPNVGFGALAEPTEAYFRAGLRRATGGDRHRVIVVYCLRACWMSWNAARRARAWGYDKVFWYAEGTDGWYDAGFPLEARETEP